MIGKDDIKLYSVVYSKIGFYEITFPQSTRNESED